MLDEIVLVVNARMPGLQGFWTALRHHALNPATALVLLGTVQLRTVRFRDAGCAHLGRHIALAGIKPVTRALMVDEQRIYIRSSDIDHA